MFFNNKNRHKVVKAAKRIKIIMYKDRLCIMPSLSLIFEDYAIDLSTIQNGV